MYPYIISIYISAVPHVHMVMCLSLHLLIYLSTHSFIHLFAPGIPSSGRGRWVGRWKIRPAGQDELIGNQRATITTAAPAPATKKMQSPRQ